MSDKGLLLFFSKDDKNVVLTNSLPHVIILSVYLHLLLNDTTQKSDSLLNIYFFFKMKDFLAKSVPHHIIENFQEDHRLLLIDEAQHKDSVLNINLPQ